MTSLLLIKKLPKNAVLLIASFAIFLCPAIAQSDYLSIFGNAGCTSAKRFSAASLPVPPSFSPIANLSDPATSTIAGLASKNFFQNSQYDASGNLLFSVNANGIYNTAGIQVFNFDASVSGTTATAAGTSCSHLYYPVAAESEISIIPDAMDCNSYIAVFFCRIAGTYTLPDYQVVLRAVKIHINPTTGSLSFTDHLLNADCGSISYVNILSFVSIRGGLEIASHINIDRSVDIYTVELGGFALGGTLYNYGAPKKYHLWPSGTLPVTVSPIPVPGIPPAAGIATKAKIIEMPSTTTPGTTELVLAYPGFALPLYSMWGYCLQTILLTPPYTTHQYYVPPSTSTFPMPQRIWGFEYLPPPLNVFCVAYTDDFLGPTAGGLAYSAPTSAVSTPCTALPGTFDYRYSDLELDKHGDMLLVKKDPVTGDGVLAYLPASLLTSTFTSSAPIVATPTGCMSYPYISVSNRSWDCANNESGYYLGKQTNTPPPYHMLNYTAHIGETWTPTSNPITAITGVPTSVIKIRDWIDIPAGTELNITGMTVEMGPSSHIYVNNATGGPAFGGRLRLSNATLTGFSSCAGTQFWGGVVIKGNNLFPQLTPALSKQGVMTMCCNSTVAYAEVGAHLGDAVTTSNTGGILQVNNSRFYNNLTGVTFGSYRNFDPASPSVEISNICYFYRSYFTTDAVMDGVMGTKHGIAGAYVNGIKITGCVFENLAASQANYVGLYSASMGFTVDMAPIFGFTPIYTTFSNYNQAISTNYVGGSYSQTIRNTVFSNNHMGIVCQGGIAPAIEHNTFNVPAYGGTPTGYYPGSSVLIVDGQNAGILLNGTTGYNIRSNVFKPASPILGYNPFTTGIICHNTGSAPNLVTDNKFSNLGVAMLSNFINNSNTNGLKYYCNDAKTSNNYGMAILGTGLGNGGIHPSQQYPLGSVIHAAGNKFPGTNDIFNQQKPISYLYSSGTAEYPAIVSGPVTTTLTSNLPICSSTPAGPTSGILYVNHNLSVATAVSAYAFATAKANYFMTDTLGPVRDSVYFYATLMNSPDGDLLVADMLIQDSLIDSAFIVYDNIIGKFGLDSTDTVSANEFLYGRGILEVHAAKRVAGDQSLSLTPVQINDLAIIKSITRTWARARASVWTNIASGLAFSDTLLYPDTMKVDQQNGQGGSRGSIHNNSNTHAQIADVYPNPVHDVLNIIYNQEPGISRIEIKDITGRRVISEEIQNGMPNKLDVSKLKAGVYLYAIFDGKKLVGEGRIVKD